MFSVPELSGISTNLVTEASKNPLLSPANIKRGKDQTSEMVERPPTIWDTSIFFDESRCVIFSDSGRV